MIELTFAPEGYSDSFTGKFTEEQAKALKKLEEKEAFEAYFWAEKIDWMNNGNVTESNHIAIRTENGNHYTISTHKGLFQGHSGREFIVIMENGEKIKTSNLWHQGEIPSELRNILTQNAIVKQADGYEGKY